LSALAARKRSGLPFSGSLGLKKEIPQIYNVEPAVASEIEDEVDPDMFTQTLVLSSGKILCIFENTCIITLNF